MDEIKKISSSIIKFLRNSGKIEFLPEIIRELKLEEEKMIGEGTAIITSSYRLDANEMKEVEKRLLPLFKNKLKLVNRIDKELVGGLVIQVSDRVIDLSLNNYLNNLEAKIRNEKN